MAQFLQGFSADCDHMARQEFACFLMMKDAR